MNGVRLPSLGDLVGLQLSFAGYAGNMRTFHFRELDPPSSATAGEYGLHVQCPWRIENDVEILTGFHDWYHFAGDGTGTQDEPEDWEPARDGGSFQELRLRQLFACPRNGDTGLTNRTRDLVVIGATVDPYGGCGIVFGNGVRLVIFPCAALGEHWRLFRLDDHGPHLVVEGSRAEGDDTQGAREGSP